MTHVALYHNDSQEGQRQSTHLIVSSIAGNDNKVLGHSIRPSGMFVVKLQRAL